MSHRYEVVKTTTGAISIRSVELNEIMHNPVGPWLEANALYIEQSRLRDRLLEPATAKSGAELVLFDVGLGAAANALAALHMARAVGDAGRPLRLVSFERDLELLRFALANSGQFGHFAGFETAIETLLREKRWSEGRIEWILHEGDFLETVETEASKPHLIYYDPYSLKVDQNLWTSAAFVKLRRHCREGAEGGSVLFTYSQSTRIRVALFLAGFFVGRGIATGLKESTTQAATRLGDLDLPLDGEWLAKWKRSHLKTALDSELQATEASILGHPQFRI